MSKLSKAEKSWVLYDVANSAFTMLISTTIPIFFRSLAEQQVSRRPPRASGDWPPLPLCSFWRSSPPFWELWPTTAA